VAEKSKRVHWIEVKIRCNGELAEALAEVLGRFVSNGVALENITEFNPHSHENTPTGEMIVSGYLAVNEHLEERQRKLEEALWHLSQIAPVSEPQYKPILDEDWMATWKQHYTPIPISDSLLITPAWEEPHSKPGQVIIRINPAMAFGTGAHPTSQLCLRLLEHHITPGIPVIDIGSGSGILSITALKLGAERVLAVDISEEAVASTRENAGLNQISADVLETGKGSVEEVLTGRFTLMQAPLVMVNILAPVIIRLFGQGLGNLVAPSGKLLLSGILDHQAEDVLEAARQAGFSLVEQLSHEDWVAFAVMKSTVQGS
jgi:ribosomal protein L11 methyltransferase